MVSDGKGKRIVIVEDERLVAEDIKYILESLGYKVVAIYTNGSKLLADIEKKNPDLILMDIMLSGKLDGIETAHKLRSIKEVPIIYLTAYVDDKTLSRAKLTEPYGYIVKPYDERILRSTIETAFYKYNIEQKIKESESKLFTTLKSIGDAVITTDAEGKINFMNPVAEKITGWTLSEVIDEDVNKVFDIYNEFTGKKAEDPVSKVLGQGIVVGLANHTILKTRDGKYVPIADSGAPIKDSKGNLYGVVLVFQDITERKEAERKIRESERKYHALFENANDGIFLMKGEVIIDCNRKSLEIFGCDYKGLVGKTPFDFSPELQPDGMSSRVKGMNFINSAMNGTPQFFEWVHKRKSAELFDAEISLSRIDIDGDFYILAIIRDISDKKAYLKKIKESEEKFRMLSEKSIVGIYIIQDDKFIYVNPCFLQMTGYDMNEVIGKDYRELVHPDSLDFVEQNIRKSIYTSGYSLNYTFRLPTKYGHDIYVEVFNSMIEYNNRNAVVGTIIDRTEEVRAKNELIAYKEDLERKYYHLDILYKISEISNKTDNVKELADKTIDVLSGFLQYARTSIFSYNKEENTLVLLSAKGFGDEFDKVCHNMPVDESLNGFAIREKKLIICDDMANDNRIFEPKRKVLKKNGLNYAIIVPLIAGEDVLGSILLVFKENPNISDFEMNVLKSISETVSIALKKITSLDELEREINVRKITEEKLKNYAERLEILRAIDLKIIESKNLDEVLKYILKEVRKRIKVDATAVIRIYPEQRKVRIVNVQLGRFLKYKKGVEFTFPKGGNEMLERYKQVNKYVVSDLEKDEFIPDHIKEMSSHGLRAFIDFPLRYKNDVIGVFGVGGRSIRKLSDEDVKFCEEISSQIAIALVYFEMKEEVEKSKMMLEQKVEERTKELQKIVNSLADRELKMVELKEKIKELKKQLEDSGLKPIVD
ncbi:MAG: PAS domain S-box protein [Candidatus Marinimicrobia bacterium]|nr:PAS domain S-box protein [Candidatus Neomarinimicrobiota bacterium]